VEVLNDINGDLVTLYRVVQNHVEEFVRQFKWALSSRQVFEWQKMTRPETLTDIQRAARFFYLQHHAFAGKVTGQTFGTAITGPAINLLRIEKNLSAAWQRLSGTFVENLPWQECAEHYDVLHHNQSTAGQGRGQWRTGDHELGAGSTWRTILTSNFSTQGTVSKSMSPPIHHR